MTPKEFFAFAKEHKLSLPDELRQFTSGKKLR